MAILSDLHTDLLDKIAGFLPTNDLINLSMTCRQLFEDTKRTTCKIKLDYDEILHHTMHEYYVSCKRYKLDPNTEIFVEARTNIKAYVMKSLR